VDRGIVQEMQQPAKDSEARLDARAKRNRLWSRTLLLGVTLSAATLAVRWSIDRVISHKPFGIGEAFVFLVFDLPFSLFFGYLAASSLWRSRSG
jgi:hypothetical protein